MIITFNRLLQKYREAAFSKEDLGRRFERLMLAYLQTDPKYAILFTLMEYDWEDFLPKYLNDATTMLYRSNPYIITGPDEVNMGSLSDRWGHPFAGSAQNRNEPLRRGVAHRYNKGRFT